MATRRAQTSRESRQLLIQAATELFAERGFRQTTFADIADRSGISRGSIPWHFGNKDGLLQAVIEELTVDMADLDSAAHGLGDGLDRVRDQLRQPTMRLLITLVAEAVEPGSPVHGFYAQLHDSIRKWVAGWVAESDIPSGTGRDDFVAVVVGAVIGLHQQWRVAPEAIDLDRSFDALKALTAGGGDHLRRD
ncbi:TetR/AcrR family transcriptional regulator [Mycolicibacterium thermoresistibile]